MGALWTDLYELNMAASYLRRGMAGPATFSLFARDAHAFDEATVQAFAGLRFPGELTDRRRHPWRAIGHGLR